MKTEAPAIAKLKMMKASTKCLALGLLSLMPILGVGFALFEAWYSDTARRRERFYWNPAKPHRIIGSICAALGGLVWGAVDTIWIFHITTGY
jgi:hypothetical protein